jgi:hypothetical protein
MLGYTIAPMIRLVLCLAFAIAVVSACGHPGPERIEFVFTPIAVKTIDGSPPLSIDDNCAVFVADEVIAIVEIDEAREFGAWLKGIDFEDKRVSTTMSDATFVVAVPAGSVPDAIPIIRTQDGVIAADPNYLAVPPGTAPLGGRLFGCKSPCSEASSSRVVWSPVADPFCSDTGA